MADSTENTATADRFMSVAVHDLRNPVAVVKASAQMAQRQLERGDLEAAQRRLNAIVEQSDRLSGMLETFLDAALVATGDLPLRREQVDFGEVVQAAIQRAGSLSGRAERRVDTQLLSGCLGSWDRLRLGRAVGALIENAYLFGEPSAPVSVQMHCTPSGARLVVTGGGSGPAPDEEHRLFERFYRGRAAAEVGHSGSGLGLYTARGVARAHGGDVRRLPEFAPDAFELFVPCE